MLIYSLFCQDAKTGILSSSECRCMLCSVGQYSNPMIRYCQVNIVKRRYLIRCAGCVSGITFNGTLRGKHNGEPDKLKVIRSMQNH